jgi:hypothetical protein
MFPTEANEAPDREQLPVFVDKPKAFTTIIKYL